MQRFSKIALATSVVVAGVSASGRGGKSPTRGAHQSGRKTPPKSSKKATNPNSNKAKRAAKKAADKASDASSSGSESDSRPPTPDAVELREAVGGDAHQAADAETTDAIRFDPVLFELLENAALKAKEDEAAMRAAEATASADTQRELTAEEEAMKDGLAAITDEERLGLAAMKAGLLAGAGSELNDEEAAKLTNIHAALASLAQPVGDVDGSNADDDEPSSDPVHVKLRAKYDPPAAEVDAHKASQSGRPDGDEADDLGAAGVVDASGSDGAELRKPAVKKRGSAPDASGMIAPDDEIAQHAGTAHQTPKGANKSGDAALALTAAGDVASADGDDTDGTLANTDAKKKADKPAESVACKGESTVGCMHKVLYASKKVAKTLKDVHGTGEAGKKAEAQAERIWGLSEKDILMLLAADATPGAADAIYNYKVLDSSEGKKANETAEEKKAREAKAKKDYEAAVTAVEAKDEYKKSNSEWNREITKDQMDKAYHKLENAFEPALLSNHIRYDVIYEVAEASGAIVSTDKKPADRSGMRLMATEGSAAANASLAIEDGSAADGSSALAATNTTAEQKKDAKKTAAKKEKKAAKKDDKVKTEVHTLNPVRGNDTRTKVVAIDTTKSSGLGCCCISAIVSSSLAAAGGLAALIVYLVAPQAYGCAGSEGEEEVVTVTDENGNQTTYTRSSTDSSSSSEDGSSESSGYGMYIGIAAVVGVLVLLYVGCMRKGKDEEEDDMEDLTDAEGNL